MKNVSILPDCKFCGEEVELGDFKNYLSLKEYFQSGLCQECQDVTFLPDRLDWDPEDDYDGRF